MDWKSVQPIEYSLPVPLLLLLYDFLIYEDGSVDLLYKINSGSFVHFTIGTVEKYEFFLSVKGFSI
tara:strand:+ start:74 stop:271 length:198 start_codon:yes stop_codon:yes gene_type:complete